LLVAFAMIIAPDWRIGGLSDIFTYVTRNASRYKEGKSKHNYQAQIDEIG
jgi:hypothetical protein